MNEHIVIITGEEQLRAGVSTQIPDEAIVLAADGGLDIALTAGLRPAGVIGDFDSISEESLAWAEAHATIARYSPDKETTDTELALAFAADMAPRRITMIGGGDRIDHGIAAIGALGAPKLTSIPVLDAWWAGQHIDVLHAPDRRTLHLVPSSTFSVLALHGPVGRLTLRGVRWPLTNHDLAPNIGLGISNEVRATGSSAETTGTTDTDISSVGGGTGRPDDPPVGDVSIELSTGVLTIFNVPSSHPHPDESG